MTITDEIERTAVQTVRATTNTRATLDAALRLAKQTDSPIEAIFATHFTAARDVMLATAAGRPWRFALALRPQVWVTVSPTVRYRLDFAIEPMDPWLVRTLADARLSLCVGVELDGHAFHERTPAQVTARNQRDRDLAALQWCVLHFSGSELHRNPMAAVVETLEAGADALDLAKTALLRA